MKEIEGIELVLEVLRPRFDEIEEAFDQANNHYLALATADHGPIGRVLKAHLI